ncbi:hypothetical protein D3C87_1972100 [compost metagenome]
MKIMKLQKTGLSQVLIVKVWIPESTYQFNKKTNAAITAKGKRLIFLFIEILNSIKVLYQS